MKLSMGPIPFYWIPSRVKSFYDSLAKWPVDIVYIGETVCSRRRDFKLEDWLEIAKMLNEAGKEVVLSSQTLIESEGDLRRLRKLLAAVEMQPNFKIEANDQSAIHLLTEQGMPFVTGHSINIYNAQTLRFLYQRGLKRWCFPVELSRTTLASILESSVIHNMDIETEVLVYGPIPLAWSARCFTARYHDYPKDNCQFVCQKYEEGLRVSTQEDQQVFVLNGVQTLSGQCLNLADQMAVIEDMGVSIVRLNPSHYSMSEVVEHFDQIRTGRASKSDPLTLTNLDHCNGYWFGQPGMHFFS